MSATAATSKSSIMPSLKVVVLTAVGVALGILFFFGIQELRARYMASQAEKEAADKLAAELAAAGDKEPLKVYRRAA